MLKGQNLEISKGNNMIFGCNLVLTLQLLCVTKTEFLLTILIQHQAEK